MSVKRIMIFMGAEINKIIDDFVTQNKSNNDNSAPRNTKRDNSIVKSDSLHSRKEQK